MAKSPVYGTGRNFKKRKYPIHPSAGSVKMKGKKTKRMHCWCCVCIDMRDKLKYKQHQQEIKGCYDD